MALQIEMIKKLMKQHDLNQRELAGMCGVTEAAMCRYLKGVRQPGAETLANMATALHTSSNDLLGLEPPMESEKLYSLVARNAATIPEEIRMKLIHLLASPQDYIDGIDKADGKF
ncbi:MAG: helix-turn-helix domain-containing protein [Opitutales bacterium]|nr:helix-turn-helix domain-containing protein [Opitutales bacterium]